MSALDYSDGGPSLGDDGHCGFGHYQSVRPYGDCEGTSLGSTFTYEGGARTARAVWFGDPAEACVDLAATEATHERGHYDAGEAFHATATVQNQGSAQAPASVFAYYLSRDAVFEAAQRADL